MLVVFFDARSRRSFKSIDRKLVIFWLKVTQVSQCVNYQRHKNRLFEVYI